MSTFSPVTDVIIPEKIGGKNVIKIGEEAFSPNKDRISKQIQETRRKIVSIHIPNTVKSIGSKAFYDCENLKSIKLSSKISSIGYGAFLGCVELSNIELPETIKTIGGEGFCGCKSLRKIQLPSKISKLDYATFNSCTKLEIIELPQTIKQIREWNFYNCPNLTIHAPAGSYAESYAKENNIPFVAE